MITSRFALLRRALTLLAVVGVLLFPVSSVFAAATSFTVTFHDVTESFPDTNPCSGAAGIVTLTYNGVVHVTLLRNGTSHFTITQTGDLVFVPANSAEPTFTGHFTFWDGENENRSSDTDTEIFVVHAVGSDGSTVTIHEVEHVSVSASGVTISFDKPKLTCG